MSDTKKRKTGLGAGVNAFFGGHPEDSPATAVKAPEEDSPATAAEKAPEPQKPEKIRTTVMLYPNTLSDIELLKSEARKQGVRATMSDILNDAVQLLKRQRSIS